MTQISEMLKKGRTFSFEFFPPKNDEEQAQLVRVLHDLVPLSPSFVSVTYRGGRSSRKRTHDLVAGLKQTTALIPMAHLICVDHTRLELAEILLDLRKAGVVNLMALGGDPPKGEDQKYGELTYAIELVELAQAIGGFSIGVAAQPQGHPDSSDMESDRRHLAEKLRKADFAITQFFFEVDHYMALVDDLSALGVDKPVLPGILPIERLSSVGSIKTMGASVPPKMIEKLENAQNSSSKDPTGAVKRAGIEMAVELCQKLLDKGCPGLHFYTLNRSTATREIYDALNLNPATSETPNSNF
ncbi:MAG: 5,10-methylenetetrahydrofolate reductase [Acidimicrobiales bacterium]|nr:5,10-methylenetetrahydrofolate reductase [Acidimicrobiales bacterium]